MTPTRPGPQATSKSSAAIAWTSEVVAPRAGKALAAASRAIGRLDSVHPVAVLAPLVAAHFAVVAAIALTAEHNGWLFSMAGTGAHEWTASWALGHLWIPTSVTSYGLPVLLWPFALAFGGSLPAALPAIVVLQVAIGGAALLLATYGIASRIAGRLFGYVAALGWVLAPLLALGFFYPGHREFQGIPYNDYRGLVHDTVLPEALGLTIAAEYASLVALAVAAWLLVRCLDTGDWNDVLLGGLTAGFGVAIEPGNALFLPAPLLALAVARRWRQGLAFVAALLPAVGTLALWRWTGLGHVRGFEGLAFSWEDFRIIRIHFRGAGWSLLLVEWIAVAGIFALVRKAPAKGALVAAWFVGFFVLNSGSLARGRVLDGTIFRLLEPGYPAFVLLAAALVLLVPMSGRWQREPAPRERRPRLTRGLAATAIVLGLYPLALVALAGPTPRDRVVFQHARAESVPVSGAFALRVEQRDGLAVLTWKRPSAGATTLSYRIYRSPGPGCAPGGRDCRLRMAGAATIRATSWTDPEPGRSWYRVAAVADSDPNRIGGGLLLISPAVRAP
jgi:hypothetical protein